MSILKQVLSFPIFISTQVMWLWQFQYFTCNATLPCLDLDIKVNVYKILTYFSYINMAYVLILPLPYDKIKKTYFNQYSIQTETEVLFLLFNLK